MVAASSIVIDGHMLLLIQTKGGDNDEEIFKILKG
jgi:hypothetical protein